MIIISVPALSALPLPYLLGDTENFNTHLCPKDGNYLFRKAELSHQSWTAHP